jgi:hypothetical protein
MEAREAHGWLAIEKKRKKIYSGFIINPCPEKGGNGKGMLLFMIGK